MVTEEDDEASFLLLYVTVVQDLFLKGPPRSSPPVLYYITTEFIDICEGGFTKGSLREESTNMETKTKIIIGVVVAILAIVIGLLSSSFRRLSTEEGIGCSYILNRYSFLKLLLCNLVSSCSLRPSYQGAFHVGRPEFVRRRLRKMPWHT